MASAEKRVRRGSGPTLGLPLSPHAAHCPSPCTEDLGDLHHRLEKVQLDDPHGPGKPPRTATESPPSEIAWRALDLKFKVDVDDGQVIQEETDYCDDGDDDDDDDHSGQVIYGDTKTNCSRKIICPGRKDYTKSDAKDIDLEYMDRYCERMGAYSDVCDAIFAREDYGYPFPPFPLKEFPPATSGCFKDG
ncbi:uncharacterized protein LOC100839709 isoform X2 [Brachypodium distachyon]|uniref:uncharacterized protein LOC100839709 isoform X2 n=1 Tax=Brachypodium distachyon TaxID=15368 RepID=UPI00071DC7DB|nr:uncharacterized protein LOC100839709 isoform X2 [Brachypodium distachyon]|eukprot:XP_024316741.1 uncharacterized protein LOC100839709 isoform X2 [Brachypodium distachyon]